MASGMSDPPQTTTNIVGFKRLRKVVKMADPSGAANLTLSDLRACLPLTTPDLRVVKLSVWSANADMISCVFPVGSTNNVHPGDDAAWSDTGVVGQSVAQLHITPAFDYRNFWFVSGFDASTVLATFAGAAGTIMTVDVSVNYRTAVQSCPALLYLNELRAIEPKPSSA